jgi:SAM-dependent methyltransferase
MLGLVDPCGKHVADIGCGGGIYAHAWRDLGAARVTGVDFSTTMLADARDLSAGDPCCAFRHGDATATGLPDTSVDIAFSRAVIHHLPDLPAALAEAHRILKPGGTVIIQDRTIEDVRHPASAEHLRGYFFEVFPCLLEIEERRRPASASVVSALDRAGFERVISLPLVERRAAWLSWPALEADLRARTGRSILHALADVDLDLLIARIHDATTGEFPLTEADRWTVWTGRKPR